MHCYVEAQKHRHVDDFRNNNLNYINKSFLRPILGNFHKLVFSSITTNSYNTGLISNERLSAAPNRQIT